MGFKPLILKLSQLKVAGDKGIFKMKSKQQSPCSNCMHWPVTSWGKACSTCMHKPVMCMHQPVMSQADACSYCMGSKVSSLSQIYLYSSYFGVNCCTTIKNTNITMHIYPLSLNIDTQGLNLLRGFCIYLVSI